MGCHQRRDVGKGNSEGLVEDFGGYKARGFHRWREGGMDNPVGSVRVPAVSVKLISFSVTDRKESFGKTTKDISVNYK
ncbi:MAG TPA: hypothetical protein DEP18_08830 [Flavobacteriales bacterium]|nr:hypothetical protein [Flavobacteriales bacterium]